jgi:hypothetical protein
MGDPSGVAIACPAGLPARIYQSYMMSCIKEAMRCRSADDAGPDDRNSHDVDFSIAIKGSARQAEQRTLTCRFVLLSW